MSSVLDRMERQATLLGSGRARRYEPITDLVADGWQESLAELNARPWKQVMDEIKNGGDPMALVGGIAGLEAAPPSDAIAAVTFSASEQALWPAATWTPIAASAQGPKHYELFVSAVVVTVATPGTMTFTPRIGTTTGGATLGISNAFALTASITTFLAMRGEVIVRGTGSGTNARAYGSFHWYGKMATAGTGAIEQLSNVIFGHTAATFDSTAAQGLFMGLTGSVTTPTIAIQQIRWGSWN